MYKAIFFNDISEFYQNEELIFTVKRKRLLLGLRNICSVYKDDKIIFSFYTSEFTFLYWEVKILEQKLPKIVTIEKKKWNYNLIVDEEEINIKSTDNPFKKIISNIYINNNHIGEIQKEEKNSKTYFYFNFAQNTNLKFYILILFSIHSVGITDNP